MEDRQIKVTNNEYDETVVTLEDAYVVRFFVKGLANEEYIRRAKEIRRLEDGR